MEGPLDLPDMLLRLGAAVVLGGVLGWEREHHAKPAGLRTHMLVSLGAAVMMVSAIHFMHTVGDVETLELDPFRVLAGIIGGVGFLGGGAIIQARGTVRGITTAASIWLAAAIGISCGIAYYELAVTSGAMTLAILLLIGWIERRVLKKEDV